jgi:NADH-quinone oxidoreductase subunit A
VADRLFPIFFQLVIAVAMAAGMLSLSWLLGLKAAKRGRTDLSPYECGLAPFQEARNRFSVKFYLVAMLFILFDIEAAYLFPWATVFRQLGEPAFWEMMVFIGVLLLGYFYILRRGALDWD